MKKKLFRMMLLAVAIIVFIASIEGCSYASTRKQSSSFVLSEKVHFEGVSNVVGQSFSEIANEHNSSTSNGTVIMLQLDNDYDEFVERPEGDLTMEEADAILKKQRDNVKSYYSQTNNEIMKKIDFHGLDIEFNVDEYTPFVIGTLHRELTEKDVELINLIAENKAIKKIYVRDDMKNITPSLTAFTFFVD